MTLLVDDADGTIKVVVPDDAEITFGPAIPFQAKDAPNQRGLDPTIQEYRAARREYALRIYRKKRLIAVMPRVFGFREETIKFSRVSTEKQYAWTMPTG